MTLVAYFNALRELGAPYGGRANSPMAGEVRRPQAHG
jgi:hypothetical protein